MTSRVLQENSDLLLTESSDAITNDTFIGTTGFSTGTPEVNSSSIGQTHSLTATELVTGIPEANQSTLTQRHSLSPLEVATGTPEATQGTLTQEHSLVPSSVLTAALSVGSTELDQEHTLAALDILSGSPVVSNVAMIEDETFAPPSFSTGTPNVGSPTLSQEHDLSADSLLTGIADVDRASFPEEEAIVAQEIQEIQQMIGGWGRRAYEVPDGRLVQAEREIYRQYGDKVSIDYKAKSLVKFGKSGNLIADTLSTVWTVGGNETYVTDNTIEYISSSSALDTQEITLECHTVSGTGVNSQFTFLTQTVTLNGQNPVALPTPVARVSHAYNSNGTELVGRVTVYENATLSGGVPTDASKIHIDIPAGSQGALKGATTFSNSDYYILTGGFGSVSKKQDASADFYLEVRTAGGVFIQTAAISASSGGPWNVELDPAVIIPKNADVRITADASANNTVVFGVFKGYLAKVI